MIHDLASICLSSELNYAFFHACSGAALLVEAASMGDPDAQYELGCRLRIEVFHMYPLSLPLNKLNHPDFY